MPADKFEWLRRLGIRTVVDVGANIGQWAAYIHRVLPESRIVSVEPLPEAFEALCRNLGGRPGFTAVCCAVSDYDGETEFRRSSFDQSSSILPMGSLHKECFPFSAGEEMVRVPCRTLDGLCGDLAVDGPLLVKLDVQGVEDRVIRGGLSTLESASVVVCETSFVELYEGQCLFKDVVDLLYPLGFVYAGTWEEPLRSPLDGSCLEEDSIFVRRPVV